MKHLLIMGRPGVGKTTLMQHLAGALRRYAIDGFFTEELREGGHRLGFWLSFLDGRQMLLAHRHQKTGPRVGPYHVNVGVLDEAAVSVIQRAIKQALVLFLDELGKMELSSALFEKTVAEAFDHGPSIVATAGLAPHPFITALKHRKDVEIILLTAANRHAVEEELLARLEALCAEDEVLKRLQRMAERICEMIVSGEAALIDIEIQQEALHQAVLKAFPDKETVYQLIYESRFRRLWQQFRQHTQG